MLKEVKLVIFDLDGTLVDAYLAIADSINFLMKEMELPPKKADAIRRAVGWGDKNLVGAFVEKRHLDKALKIYRRHHQGSLKEKTRFLPGAKRLLADLKKKGYRLAIASNRPTKFSHIILKCLGIENYFDYVLCADKVKRGKPHPDILLHILKKLSVKPGEALYVGDMAIDVLAGQRAKVKTVSVVTGSSTKTEIKKLKPFLIINSISDISRILHGKS